MKIAQIVQPWLPVPPPGYGGTERVVSLLTEGLVKRGHEVTLFASGDSKTSAHLSAYFEKSFGNNAFLKSNPYNSLLHLIQPFRRASEFDILHSHTGYMGILLASLVTSSTKVVHTMHGAYYPTLRDASKTLEQKRDILRQFPEQNYVSISNYQRIGEKSLHYVATVYNGIPLEEFPLKVDTSPHDYLVWVGRITPDKGLPVAFELARRVGIRLEFVGFIDPGDKVYFDEVVKPQIDGKLIIYHGELESGAKTELIQGAKAFVFPIEWEEPFGLVMTEAMACGTPVIAFARGSVPEVIADGETGYIVNFSKEYERGNWMIQQMGIEGLVKAVESISKLTSEQYKQMRQSCRLHVETYFSAEKMVAGYEEVYKKILFHK